MQCTHFDHHATIQFAANNIITLTLRCAVWGVAGAVWLTSATASVAYLHIGAAYPDLLGRGSHSSAEMKSSRSDYALPPCSSQTSYLQVPTQEQSSGRVSARGALQGGAAGGALQAQSPGSPAISISPSLYRVTVLLILAWINVALMGGLLAQAALFYQASRALLPE